MGDLFLIREAVTADTAAMAAIERTSFGDPWSVESFVAALGPLTIVAEQGGAIAGYLVGRHVLDEAEILDLAVRVDLRRKGVARQLVRAVAAQAGGLGVTQVHLEVREQNLAALALYRSLGFRQVGRRAGYYLGPSDNALLFALEIGKSSGSA